MKDAVDKREKKRKKTVTEAEELREERLKLEEQGADETKVFDVETSLKDLEKKYLDEFSDTSTEVSRAIEQHQPPKEDESGMAKWYADLLKKESGFDIGKDVRIWRDVDFKKGGAKIEIGGKS